MRVSELMTTDVVTCPSDATLRDAVERLQGQDVGSVIVVDDDGAPAGILTESDILEAGHQTDLPFSEIPVAKVGHGPVFTAKPAETVQRLARRMTDKGVKKVPVMDDLELVGIVTLTDIVWHLSDLRSEAAEIAEMGDEWGPKD